MLTRTLPYFQERAGPHVHSFIYIFNAPNIQNETVSTLLKKNINAESLDNINNLKLFELAVNAHSRTLRKHIQNECHPPKTAKTPPRRQSPENRPIPN